MSRRTFLAGTISGVAGAVLLDQLRPAMALESPVPSETFGIPGPFPGRVIEVRHPGAVVGDRVVVALDHIGWETIDAKRQTMGLPLVVDAYARLPDEKPQSSANRRQPQHIALAAALGLGVFDRDKIDLRRIPLGADGSSAPPPRVE